MPFLARIIVGIDTMLNIEYKNKLIFTHRTIGRHKGELFPHDKTIFF